MLEASSSAPAVERKPAMTAAAAVPPYVPSARRPGLITLLMVLVIISGVFSLIGGITLVLLRNNAQVANQVTAQDGLSGSTASTVALWAGIAAIVIGVIYLLVAKGLGNGNSFARGVVAFFTVLSILGGFFTMFGVAHGTRWSGLVSVLIGVAVLAILYSRRANAFYSGR